MVEWLKEVAAATEDFGRRLDESRKIQADLSDSEMNKSNPVALARKSAPDTLNQVREQIAADAANLAERQRQAAQISTQHAKDNR
jgi:hypothetical protein